MLVGAAELVAGHFAAAVAVAAVAAVAVAAVAVAVADAAVELQLVPVGAVELATELVVLVAVPVFVHSGEFAAGLVVGGELG